MNQIPTGLTFVSDFLTGADYERVVDAVSSLTYTHDKFRGRNLKRGYAQYGFSYVTSGRRLDSSDPLPDFLQPLIDAAVEHCPDGTLLNQCIITKYPKSAGIGWHTDAPCFGETIVGVSLGSTARFQFRRNGEDDASYELEANPGSMYVMTGDARHEYQHSILAVKSLRYSITLRHVDSNAAVT